MRNWRSYGWVKYLKISWFKELKFDYNTKETRVGIEEGVSLEVEFYAMRVLIKSGV